MSQARTCGCGRWESCPECDPNSYCEHGHYYYSGNQEDVCQKCLDAMTPLEDGFPAEPPKLRKVSALLPDEERWGSFRDPDDEPSDLDEYSELLDDKAEEDEADLAEEEEPATEDEEFVVQDGELTSQERKNIRGLARDMEPEIKAEQHGSFEAACRELGIWWENERYAHDRVAIMMTRAKQLFRDEPGFSDLTDEDIQFWFDMIVFGVEKAEMHARHDPATMGPLRADSSKPFRFQGSAVLLTYNIDMTLKDFEEIFKSHKWAGENKFSYVIGRELAPSTGQVHFHCLLDFHAKQNIKGYTFFQFFPGCPTADIKSVTKGKKREKREYCMKNGNYVERWDAVPYSSKGFKRMQEDHKLWLAEVKAKAQLSPFPFQLIGDGVEGKGDWKGPVPILVQRPNPAVKRRHYIIKGVPDCGKSRWAHEVAAGKSVFFPRKGNKYPLEGKGGSGSLR